MVDDIPIFGDPSMFKKGFRLSLKDILSKEEVDTLKNVSKAVKRGRGRPPKNTAMNADFEVEIKNDKGNPLPVTISKSSFKFAGKLSDKIDNVLGSTSDIPNGLNDLKTALEKIKGVLVNQSGQEKLLLVIDESINRLAAAISSGDKNGAVEAAANAKNALKATEESNKGITDLTLSVAQAVEIAENISNSSITSLQEQKISTDNLFTILKDSGYNNEKVMNSIAESIAMGDKKQIALAIKSLKQDQNNYLSLKADSKRSRAALQDIIDINTSLAIKLEEASVQELLQEKFKKTSRFTGSGLGRGLGGIVSSMLGMPGLSLLAGPLMDVFNLIGGKNLLKGGRFLGKGINKLTGGSGLAGLTGGAAKIGGKLFRRGAVPGVLSAGMAGYGSYQDYQEAKERGASKEELGKIKTKGIAKTAGSGIGGLAGAALGSLVGPVGTVVGGALGSIAGEWAGEKLGEVINEKGIQKLVDSITGFFKSIKDWVSQKFSSAWSSVKTTASKIADMPGGYFKQAKESLKDLVGPDGIIGVLSSFLKKIFEISPLSLITKNLDSITKGIDNLFGEQGVFGTAKNYMNDILDSYPVKALMAATGYSSLPTAQKSTPSINSKDLDARSAKLAKDELEEQRKFRRESSKPTVITMPAAAVSSQAPARSMNNTPQIDDYGIAFMNSAVFD